MQVLSTHTLHPRTSSVTCSYPGCRNHLCFGQVARFRSLGEASQKLVFCEAGTYVLCVCAAAFAFTSVPSRVTRLLFYVAICALSLSLTPVLSPVRFQLHVWSHAGSNAHTHTLICTLSPESPYTCAHVCGSLLCTHTGVLSHSRSSTCALMSALSQTCAHTYSMCCLLQRTAAYNNVQHPSHKVRYAPCVLLYFWLTVRVVLYVLLLLGLPGTTSSGYQP